MFDEITNTTSGRTRSKVARVQAASDRDGDPALLANYFLNRFNKEFGRNIRGFTESAVAAMNNHPWPGNVRELENKMKRAVVMADKRLIDAEDLELAEAAAEDMPDLDLRNARLRAEWDVIRQALARSNNTLSAAARLLGISRPTLYTLMEAHGLDTGIARSGGAEAESAGAEQRN
jgi:two-component system NtrC family response regulator